jgi:RNA polymerase sigma-70 factor (ECF subfamily)
MTEPTDEQLMTTLNEEESSALTELVRRYQNDVFRFCLHYVKDVEAARDLAQETFVRVYVARARFDANRRFKPWLLCIARNLCLNHIKRSKTVRMESLEEYASSARSDTGTLETAADDAPDQLAATEERHALLRAALAELDEESREIVVLRFFEKLPAREIAEVVDTTEGAVRTRLHRILKGMRAKYANLRDTV